MRNPITAFRPEIRSQRSSYLNTVHKHGGDDVLGLHAMLTLDTASLSSISSEVAQYQQILTSGDQ